MGLSRNKVAVPEGAAGTPPFWSDGNPSWIVDMICSLFLLVRTVLFDDIQETRGPAQGGSAFGSTPDSPPCLQGKKIFDILTQAKL